MPAIEFIEPSECPLTPYHQTSTLNPVTRIFGTGRYRNKQFVISQCHACGLGVTSPIPSETTALELYSDRSSNDFQPDDSTLTSKVKSFAARHDARKFAALTQAPKYILDYGCGNGEFAVALGSIFPGAESIGSDFHPSAPPMLAGAGRYIPIDKLGGYSGRFDLIVARHVLEHTYDPIGALKSIRPLLAPNGIVTMEVPCLFAGSRHIFGGRWAIYYAPYHPVHFTRESLAFAFKEAGLSILKEGDAELPMMGRSIQNVLNCKYNLGLFGLGVALHPLQVYMSKITGHPTCLRIWAKALPN